MSQADLQSILLIAATILAMVGMKGYAIWRDSYPKKPKRKALKVGDKMPPHVHEETHHFGGFVKVCPTCDRIDAIFIP